MSDSHNDEEGVIGYQATTVTPDRRGGIAFDQNLPGRFVHPLDDEGVLLGEIRFGVIPSRLEGAEIQLDGLGLSTELLLERLLHEAHVDPEQPGEDAVVDHVADKATQLGVGTDWRDQLVERHRVKHQVVAQGLELERLIVNDRGSGLERQNVFLGGLRVHRHKEIDFLLPADVASFAGADRVPSRQAGNVRGEHVLAGHRHAHQ